MSELVHNDIPPAADSSVASQSRRPPWLRVRVKDSETYRDVSRLIDGLTLHTVCEEARCPNIWECWGQHRTATFMILGDVCTRACRYCAVTKGRPKLPPDPAEPERVADAVAQLRLAHAVITSVDRDDLPDFGAGHFVATIAAIRKKTPECRIELLTPDFAGDEKALDLVLAARPDVFGHNVETVPRLYRRMRPKGSYSRALELIAHVDRYRREHGARMFAKSGLMVGLGEEREEILQVMDDLLAHGCDVLTIGQYLNPTRKHAPVARFYTPEEFAELRAEGLRRGFRHVVSGPLVRSSYHAYEHVPPPSSP
jgi:lipoyl synthase